jgi:hypothetical protein
MSLISLFDIIVWSPRGGYIYRTPRTTGKNLGGDKIRRYVEEATLMRLHGRSEDFSDKGLESFPQVCAEFKRAGYWYEGSEPDLRLGPKD